MFSREGGAVERDEGLAFPRAVLVDRLRDEFLARAGLALDEHAGVRGGDAFEFFDDVAHLRAVADDALEAVFLVEPAVQLEVGPPQPGAFGRPFGARPKLGDVDRLEQIVERPALHCRDRGGDRAVAGHADDFGVGLLRFGEIEDAEPVDVVHYQVGNDDVEGGLPDDFRAREPEVATRQWQPIRSRLSATVSAWDWSLSIISTSAGGSRRFLGFWGFFRCLSCGR